MHFLCHLLIPLFFLFGLSSIFDGLYVTSALLLLLVLHLLLSGFCGVPDLVECLSLDVWSLASGWSECFLVSMPLLAWVVVSKNEIRGGLLTYHFFASPGLVALEYCVA